MFRIEYQPFDSGRIAGRVGVVHLENHASASRGLGAELLAAGRRQGYDLLTLATPAATALEGFEARGILVTLEAEVAELEERLRKVPAKAVVRTLADGDWPAVEGLLGWAAATRFSSDPRLADEVARAHKLAMLRAHAERCPEHALIAAADEVGTEVVGFQISYLEEETAVLYEIVVDPAHRRRFVAVDLLAENVRRLAGAGARRAVSRIYRDNTASLRLFERIGMRRDGREEHHYHAWLEGPAGGGEAELEDTIRRYLEESFLVEFGDEVSAGTDLFEAHVIDSFGFVELVGFLESTFEVKIADEDLLSNRLNSLDSIVALMRERVLASRRN